MRILLVNVPHTSIGSRIPDDHLPPLGLLCIGGPLIDAGHQVKLIDADIKPLTIPEILQKIIDDNPEAVLLGHSGSTSAHSTIVELAHVVKAALPKVWIIYGGVFPTYHWREALSQAPAIDIVIRGEGEETALRLITALATGVPYNDIPGLAYRDEQGTPVASPRANLIANLDAYRVGWDLINHRDYSYWGGKRAVVVQFSRGCPHLCTYCGQRAFWTRWRYRDPVKFAAEIAWLHRAHGVEVFNFADENPSAGRRPWKGLLEALIAENIDITIVASTRTGDIVRDADILHLYKKAGVIRFLLGTESTDDETLKNIRKGATASVDREAIRLLRQHGIISMATWVLGFYDETDKDCWRGLKTLLSYDPDQIQLLFVTPHRWTAFFNEVSERRVIQTDQRKWDYKHQVLATKHMSPWRLLLWSKFIEAVMQIRPKALARTYLSKDPDFSHAMRWYTQMGRRVWLYELYCFFFSDKRTKHGPTVMEFWGKPYDSDEFAMNANNTPSETAQ